mmetsp:Transcript_21003/g.38904  ORF Transcript_21003/g.38904 Transcript_21003/m.38904 type:complete len:213 (-) Transcript_21003:220-858(-)
MPFLSLLLAATLFTPSYSHTTFRPELSSLNTVASEDQAVPSKLKSMSREPLALLGKLTQGGYARKGLREARRLGDYTTSYDYCYGDCLKTSLGDGICNEACYNQACEYDKNDCPVCSEGCPTFWVGNGLCDNSCNVVACGYDNGDCGSSSNTDSSNNTSGSYGSSTDYGSSYDDDSSSDYDDSSSDDDSESSSAGIIVGVVVPVVLLLLGVP